MRSLLYELQSWGSGGAIEPIISLLEADDARTRSAVQDFFQHMASRGVLGTYRRLLPPLDKRAVHFVTYFLQQIPAETPLHFVKGWGIRTPLAIKQLVYHHIERLASTSRELTEPERKFPGNLLAIVRRLGTLPVRLRALLCGRLRGNEAHRELVLDALQPGTLAKWDQKQLPLGRVCPAG